MLLDPGQREDYSTEKAQTLLGWMPRPARDAIVDCARAILADRAAVGTAA